ncbi:hypothetical protein F1D05_15120 [Kribbella qitaiheensis]|uniref:Uncharacterized protein n=1 Tax=Kribbella qitaiheensis TaxID=1544730 RepID=A0A7G6WYD4_9ACTN|nr:hypothetical protein [Kribbella qitaiheensis]QNE18999.1 hypothetical protein F1D05_15120 [Kribbella qitaiheensis]
MPEHEPEQELGPKIADAFQTKADSARGLRAQGMAAIARRRVRRRRQTLITAAATVVVAVSIGGVWGAIGEPSPVSTSAGDSKAAGEANGSLDSPVMPRPDAGCPAQHPIEKAPGPEAVPAGIGLDVQMPVYGLQACRYRLVPGDPMLLGAAEFNADTAQQVVDAIKVLPERNPALPVFKCAPSAAQANEAIVLRFDTALGRKEVWVAYDGCASVGFFTGSQTFGLYAAPLKLFMKGTVRPAGGIYLDHLKGW